MASEHEIRHTAAHVMAEAVLRMFPDAQFAIGPVIDNGFYYDFLLPRALTDKDLKQIEKEMKSIVKKKKPLVRSVVTREEALEKFKGQKFKEELISELPEDEDISYYDQDGFCDLCAGPHAEHTGEVKAFKLLSVAGAYWRGDENREQLQRIYGTAWPSKDELAAHLQKLEEAEKRDHRKLGKELDLFSIQHEEAGGGLVFWHPNGGYIRDRIETILKQELLANGYDLVNTPHVMRAHLWETSGHLGFYSDNMYSPLTVDEQEYILKPMNCPGHILIYKSRTRSYRDLPLRWAELGTVYRYERSGVLHGLMRVRGFTQDDAHLFVTDDQLVAEVDELIRFTLFFLNLFGFEKFDIYLSVRDKENKAAKFVGSDENWERAEAALAESLDKTGFKWEKDVGGAVFYGPKIDIKIRDALDRSWQCTTIQIDFNLPERFDLNYVDEEGLKRPIMIHRALLGSIERFFGVITEHYAGAFPVWLTPVQAMVIPISDRHLDYARQVAEELIEAGVRARVDDSSERMQKKIRTAQKQKVPYMLIVGDDEAETRTVSLRLRTGEETKAVPVDQFAARVLKKEQERSLEL